MEARNDADILYGLKAIAAHLGLTENQAKHRAAAGQIPTFKIGGTVCALRSAIAQHLQAAALAAQHRPPVA